MTASPTLSEVYTSPIYAALTDVVRTAEEVWCKAVVREEARCRRFGYRARYSADEMLAEQMLELLGPSLCPMEAEVAKIVAAVDEREAA